MVKPKLPKKMTDEKIEIPISECVETTMLAILSINERIGNLESMTQMLCEDIEKIIDYINMLETP